MSETDLYQRIVNELSLPQDFMEVLEKPLTDLGFHIISHQDILDRLYNKPLSHHCAQANGNNIALLHLSKEIINSTDAKAFILLLGDSFIQKVAALFFFTKASDFSDLDYNKVMAKKWKNSSPGLCEAEFFKYEIVEHVRELTEEGRKQFLSDLLTINRLLAATPATTAARPPGPTTPCAEEEEESKVIDKQHINVLVRIMATKATSVPNLRPDQYLRSVIEGATLPTALKNDMLNLTGNVKFDALNMLKAAASQKRNISDEKSTVLGSLLQPLLAPGEIDPDDQRIVAGIIYLNRLYLDEGELRALAMRFQIPDQAPPAAASVGTRSGPAFTPYLPGDTKVLQGLFSTKPTSMQDVGTLKAALKRTSAVCRVEIGGSRFGTGFLIGPDLVLTNYHVINLEGQETEQQMKDNALQARLRFGYISAERGEEARGQVFKLDGQNPILKWSPIAQLDFALLRVQESIREAQEIEPVEYSLQAPPLGTTLNMIQHPEGQTMKLALSGNGVTWKSDDSRLIQYVTPAAAGSSGSPCFNDEWNVVAIHHAEETQRFAGLFDAGTVREGILFGKIHEQIKEYLS
jgi:V8-like Glu-specific endopeptidase